MAFHKTFSVVVLCASVISSFALKSDDVKTMTIEQTDSSCMDTTGHICTCDGKPAPKNMNLTWTPQHLSPNGQVTFNIHWIVPYDFSYGTVNASLSFHGQEGPFLAYSNSVSCEQFKDYIKPLTCPIQKNIPVITTKLFQNLHVLTSYPGDYDGQIQIFTEVQGQVKEFLCLKAYIHIDDID